VKELKRHLFQKEQSLRLLHNEAESIYEDFETLYEGNELFRNQSWKELFNRMKSFSELSTGFLDTENDYKHHYDEERADVGEGINDEEDDEEEDNDEETSVSDVSQEEEETNVEQLVDLESGGATMVDDKLDLLLGDSFDKLMNMKIIQAAASSSTTTTSTATTHHDKQDSVRQWQSVKLPKGWLEEEEARRSKPGDAVYDGPTARIQNSSHRE
jgi:hypothetical protein